MEITSAQLLTAGVSVLTGGGLVAIYNALKKNKRDDFTTILESYKEQRDSHEKKIEKLETLLETLQQDLSSCEEDKQTLMLTAVFGEQLPFPFWIKNTDGRMVYINKAYTEAFKVTPEEYQGKYDIDVWGEVVAKNFSNGDKESMRKEGELWIGTELIVLDGNDLSDQWKVVKYGIWGGGPLGDRLCIASAGLAFPLISH